MRDKPACKVTRVLIDGLLALLAAFRKQTCYFYYFMHLSIFLFVENKFFFFIFFF